MSTKRLHFTVQVSEEISIGHVFFKAVLTLIANLHVSYEILVM